MPSLSDFGNQHLQKINLQTIRISTFNIRCFGFDGDYFAPKKSESRLSSLKEFLDKNLSSSDVIILQEIMDPLILNEILPSNFKHYTYKHHYKRHMHVVLCCKKEFDFIDLNSIPETALDEEKSRQCYYGKLIHGQKSLAYVVGVHLKSGGEHSQKRIFQTQKICEHLQGLAPQLPIIIGGDFNTRSKEETKNEKDDRIYLDQILKKQNLEHVPNTKFTYVTRYQKEVLDHFWTNAKVLNFHTYPWETYSPQALKDYYDQISDHIPLSAEIVI